VVGRQHILEALAAFLDSRGAAALSVRLHKSIFTLGTTCGPAERIVSMLYAGAETALPRKAEIALRMISRQQTGG
jgi:hypothetical protein